MEKETREERERIAKLEREPDQGRYSSRQTRRNLTSRRTSSE
jgi:hypothetical protein